MNLTSFPASPIAWWRRRCERPPCTSSRPASYFRNCHVTGVPVRREFFQRARAATAMRTADSAGLRRQPGRARHQPAVLDALPELIGVHARRSTSFIRPARRITPKRRLPICWRWDRRRCRRLSTTCPAPLHAPICVLCRSGASTVAEITAAGKPAIFIPLPTAADDHQRHNAETLAEPVAPVGCCRSPNSRRNGW